MWKDFFYFSKSQRVGIIVLIILTLSVLLIDFSLPYFFPSSDAVSSSCVEEFDAFKQDLILLDSARALERRRLSEERAKKRFSSSKQEQIKYTLFYFDPNTADSTTFISLGISPGIASNILKYRAKGGRFYKPEDFCKMYGLSEGKCLELKPYMLFSIAEKKDSAMQKDTLEVSEERLLVDLNLADTTELMRIPGVGSYFAKEIVRFRKISGGFYSVNQLMELKNMQQENFEKISPFCVADTTYIKKIDVNTASVEFLKRHPYINFYQAKSIYEYRKVKGKIKKIKELEKLPNFSSDDLERLRYYLIFE